MSMFLLRNPSFFFCSLIRHHFLRSFFLILPEIFCSCVCFVNNKCHVRFIFCLFCFFHNSTVSSFPLSCSFCQLASMRQTLFLACACWTVTKPGGIKLTFLTNKDRVIEMWGGGHFFCSSVFTKCSNLFYDTVLRKLN
jgi:hypothetical protein